MMMSLHVRHIKVPAQELKEMQEFLDGKGDNKEDTIVTYTAKFNDGIEADIKVCNGDTPFVDAVLFEDGHQIAVLEVEDTLEGEYNFIIDPDCYCVFIDKGE
jgi:hypothetical protein